mmetsp:Transcript_7960/g.19756  ORF Transcript_7960/g.19756 Transcript_7960/m.19756 type:complete len:209 (-) Transcript_7960:487-1113(-)
MHNHSGNPTMKPLRTSEVGSAKRSGLKVGGDPRKNSGANIWGETPLKSTAVQSAWLSNSNLTIGSPSTAVLKSPHELEAVGVSFLARITAKCKGVKSGIIPWVAHASGLACFWRSALTTLGERNNTARWMACTNIFRCPVRPSTPSRLSVRIEPKGWSSLERREMLCGQVQYAGALTSAVASTIRARYSASLSFRSTAAKWSSENSVM